MASTLTYFLIDPMTAGLAVGGILDVISQVPSLAGGFTVQVHMHPFEADG
jgi:hypothetical protein